MRNGVFISYSHKDKKWLEQLLLFLKPRGREGVILPWADTQIRAGQKWSEEIRQSLASAKAAVLIVSPYFLASDFIAEVELPSLLAAAETEGVTILPVVVSPCEVPESLSQFQAVNDPRKTLADMSQPERNRVWIAVAQAVASAAGKRPKKTRPSPARPGAARKATPRPKTAQAKVGRKAASRPEQEPAEADQGQSLNVGRELEIDGARAGDIAAYKGSDAGAALKGVKEGSLMEKGKIKNSVVGDIVFFKEESKRTED
jgi:hypothetical protein